jgi:hypothetical protein
MNGRHHLARRVGVIALGSALLAGCAGTVPEPRPAATPDEPLPALSVEQADEVLAAIAETVRAADESRNPQELSRRVADPALTLRTAQYTLAGRSGGDSPATPLSTTDQVLAVGASEEWPRTVMAVTEPPEGSTAPLLLALRQDEPRAAYRLTSWVVLFPGVETPPMAGPDVGSAQLPADAADLVATPTDTLARYADVLAKGDESEHAGLFEADPYVEQLQQELETGRRSLEGIADVSLSSAADPGSLVALETVDGGALVLGVVRTTTDYIKRLDGSTLRLGGQAGDWLRDGEVPSRANVRHDSMVAFYIPPSGEEKITVLGAERILVGATKA